MAMAPPRKGKSWFRRAALAFEDKDKALTHPGENWELRQQLNSEYRDKRADAIKRVIANHTIGKDCSGLFPDVVKNMVGLQGV